MNCVIRPLELEDEPFLSEMLYQAIHLPEGQTPLPREIIQIPELARYVQGWGREGDCGFLGSDTLTNQPIGAVWLRLPIGKHKGMAMWMTIPLNSVSQCSLNIVVKV